jgi:alanyl-tRNA synthetase
MPEAGRWTLDDVESRFLRYMQDRGHVLVEGHSVLSPTADVLFTTAGMHPLTPYLHGDPHPAGRRLCDVQRCVRTTDIDEVGDNLHLTIFEMVGNWSLGDYFKEAAIPQSMGLLTDVFGIDPHKLYVTTLAGDPADGIGPDQESPAIWAQCFADAGVDPAGRINPLGPDDNWWSNGPVGLCGPDTEMFVYVGADADPVFADTPEFVEIWNNVFMTYDRAPDGTLSPLTQRNVDTGMGAERAELFLNGDSDVWSTPELAVLLDGVASGLGVATGSFGPDQVTSQRIVADHLRAALAIAAVGITPSASHQGYVLRRLIRRAVRHAELLTGTDTGLADKVNAAAVAVADAQGARWSDLTGESGQVALTTIDKEIGRFARTLRVAVHDLHERAAAGAVFDGDFAFHAADTLGYPAELAAEEAARVGMTIDPAWTDRYEQLREEQRARSRG